MSIDQENAPASTAEEGSVEAPESANGELPENEAPEVVEEPVTEAPTTADPAPAEDTAEVAEVAAPEEPVEAEEVAAPDETGVATEPARAPSGREALVAPDLSDLPDDIGDDFERAIEATVLEFKEGDIVEGTVVSVDSDGAMIDIGYKSEGLIPTRELSIRNNVDPNDVVKVGDRVEALVLNKEDDEGRLILSKKRAMYERAWGRIQQISEGGTVRAP